MNHDPLQSDPQPEESKGPTGEQPRNNQLRFTEDGVKTQYAGVFNIGLGTDEAVLIFGNSSIDPSVVRIESKIAVSMKTAKRIAVSLGNLIRQYEEKNGVVDIARPQPDRETSE